MKHSSNFEKGIEFNFYYIGNADFIMMGFEEKRRNMVNYTLLSYKSEFLDKPYISER